MRLPGEGIAAIDRDRDRRGWLAGGYLWGRVRGVGAALRVGAPVALAAVGAGVAAVHRRGPLRDPRHRAQPGHVPAPVRGRPARGRRQRAADLGGLPARPALAGGRRCRSSAPSTVHAFDGLMLADGGRRLPRAAGAARRARRLAALRRRAGRRLCLPGRRVPRPGRVQGDDAGAVRGRVRDRADARSRSAPRRGDARRDAAARDPARGARGRQRLRLQLPGPGLAAGRARGLGGDRARAHARAAAARRPGEALRLARSRRPGSRRRRCFVARGRARARADGRLRLASRPSTPTAPGSATCSTGSRRSRRSGSGPRATSASSPATARSRRSSSTSGRAPGSAALGFGLAWWWRRGERAVPAALAAAVALWLYALIAGTPYQEAKALVLAGAAGRADLGPGALAAARRRWSRPPSSPPRAARACSRSPTGPSGRADYSPRAGRAAPGAAAQGSVRRLRPRRAARRPARPRLPGLGAARQPDLRRRSGRCRTSPRPASSTRGRRDPRRRRRGARGGVPQPIGRCRRRTRVRSSPTARAPTRPRRLTSATRGVAWRALAPITVQASRRLAARAARGRERRRRGRGDRPAARQGRARRSRSTASCATSPRRFPTARRSRSSPRRARARTPSGAVADPPRRRARDGDRGDRALARDEGLDRPADRRRLLLRLRVPRGRAARPRPTSSGSRRRCASTSTPTRRSSAPTSPAAEAIERFRAEDQPYKVELIEDLVRDEGVETVSLYRNGPFDDLCRGPHAPSTGRIGAFKLNSLAGAYWRGDETRQMLTRIYGTAFHSAKELDEHLERLEQARESDHRRLGPELDLFRFRQEAPGMPFWLPNGTVLLRLIEGEVREQLRKRGYAGDQDAATCSTRSSGTAPATGTTTARTCSSSSPPSARARRAPLRAQADELPRRLPRLRLRAATPTASCPLRLAEFGDVSRYEREGVLHGLLRVRAFTQDDAHVYCTLEQIPDEVDSICEAIDELYARFGFDDVRVELSTRPEKSIGTDEQWERAPRRAARGARAPGARLRRQPGRGDLLRAEDRLPRHRRARALLAVRHLPDRLPDAGALRAHATRATTTPSTGR